MGSVNNKQILETLQMQPLSEEEKQTRHILGRLYGPIATCKESTRNGRLYNKPLWVKALNDEIFKEKVANKSLFLELGHPSDREETDMSKACACIPELPKIVNDDLYTYVDILDTPNGRILKTLIDYGFVPGISSRGSGDVMSNDEVDPETFFLETWDIVQLPAVKKARLSVCESFDGKKNKLKKALKESYENATEEDQEIMRETLDNLDINLEEDAETLPGGTPKDINDIPWAEETEENTNILSEAADEEEVVEEPLTMEDPEIVEEPATDEFEAPVEEVTEEEPTEEEIPVEEEPVEEEPAIAEEEPVEVEGGLNVENLTTITNTLFTLLDKLTNKNNEEEIQDTVTSLINTLDLTDEDWKNIGVECIEDDGEEPEEESTEDTEEPIEDNVEEQDNEKSDETTESEKAEDASDDEEIEDKTEEETEEADSVGDDEVIESLKEMIRQKDALEKEVKALKSEKTVDDIKEKKLKEELAKYKTAFARTSEIAATADKAKKDLVLIKEQLTQKDTLIKKLQSDAEKANKLTEDIDTNAKKVKVLTEKLASVQDESEKTVSDLRDQISQCKEKFAERTAIAKKYKQKYLEAVNHYINSKASMLGVRSTDITNKLNENYTMNDIDKVCDDLLTAAPSMSRFEFGMNRGQAKMTESVKNTRDSKKEFDPDNGYDIDDSLLELAGLK